MKTVFADAFYFFALLNEREPSHACAKAFVQSYKGRVLTTAWVLTEVGDGLSDPVNRPTFALLIDTLRSEPNATIVPCSDELLDAGIELFKQRPDKNWSLTDCISFVVMRREQLTEALTGDHHFEQAGFVALLGE